MCDEEASTVLSVGVDAWNLPGDHRGIGRYVRSILREWRTSFAGRIKISLIVPEWHTWTVQTRYQSEVDGFAYPIVSRAFHERANFDVLWFPWNGCSWLSFRRPAVATLHDATSFVIPDYETQTRIIFHNAAQRCRALITDSAFSAHELARELGLPLERLTPIHLGVDMPAVESSARPATRKHPYVLFVGTAERRKGIDTVMRAVARVQRDEPHLQLVVAGALGDGFTQEEASTVNMLGFIDDATLRTLYRDADIFAFPSRYEGFGLPVLEAMAHGVPVITTDVSAIPEVAGDAVLYVPPGDEVALAAAIVRVRNDPALAESLRVRGRARAATMSWAKTAAATLDVLERAAS